MTIKDAQIRTNDLSADGTSYLSGAVEVLGETALQNSDKLQWEQTSAEDFTVVI